MDLNQLYFDHQLSLIKAQGASTLHERRGYEHQADHLADRIQRLQGRLGAAAACAWMARFTEQPA